MRNVLVTLLRQTLANPSIKNRDMWDLTALESLDRAAFHADAIDFSLPSKSLSQLFYLLL